MTVFAKLALAHLLSLALGIYLSPQTTPRLGNDRPAVSITASPGSEILPPPPNYHFPDGQSYVYGVEWHLFNAGTATVKMDSTGPDQKVTAVADSAGVVNVLYRVHDRFEGYFNPHTFCSLRVVKHTEEGSRKRDTEIRFDYPRRKSVLDEKNLKTGETKHAENDITLC